jgi:PAS domain S-box-containing protein
MADNSWQAFLLWGEYPTRRFAQTGYDTPLCGNVRHRKGNAVLLDSFSLSELRYRRLFEAARDGILLIDPETHRIVDVNPFLVEFLGYTNEEFVGKKLYQIGRPGDKASSVAAFQQLLEKGFVRYENLPLVTKDGRVVDVEFVSNIYQEGDQKIIQCNVRDISARKAADHALRQSEERFKLVTRAVSDVIWDSLWWSDGFSSTFGYLESEVEPDRASWECRIHPDDLRRVVDGLAEAVDSGAESWEAEYRFRSKDGTYASVDDKGFILRDETGVGVRMVGGLRDLSEQKKAQMQSARAQRMESIGTLAGGIAHDLNNVLTPVMMSIELLKFDSGNDADRKTILDTIQVSCRRGADLVRQVLSFARGVDGQRVPIQLPQLIGELKGMIGETFPRNIKFVTQVSGDLWPLTGDPTQLHQVLLNLAVNARDAMPNGGTLTVTATNVSLDPKEIGSSPETSAGRHVLLAVSDTGTGITDNDCEHIFEPFFTTKRIGEGTGFGLAIVHTIVKSHSGFLRVESEVGRGTDFKIYLPADSILRTVASLPPFSSAVSQGHGELVLVADDEFAIREMTRRTLESFGYRVITANNGAEAVALYEKRSHEIVLVLTDMMMPIMDGPAAIKEFKRINPSARIVAVSGLNINEDTREMVDDFLAKPYSALDLVQMVREVLASRVSRRNAGPREEGEMTNSSHPSLKDDRGAHSQHSDGDQNAPRIGSENLRAN